MEDSRQTDFQIPVIFTPQVIAGFSTRNGGVSEGHLSSLNLSYSVEDSRELVERNREIFFGHFGIALNELVTAGQVHGTQIVVVDSPGFVPKCDGLVSSVPDLFLCITAADCAAVLFADDVNGVIGACHAGWRGAAGGIVGSTIRKMESLGADTATIRAYVGPCISNDHFEVGEEVAQQFPDKYVDRSGIKPHIDLKAYILACLKDEGLQADRIELSDSCTFRDSTRFFSHRAHAGKTGRMMGFIGRRERSV
ncbi:MAG: peptidoglycan editing factor PgeF [Rhodothermales bacterium]|nr:peptidoglycan editing factor PgeF [Rhodothermales bacterium]